MGGVLLEQVSRADQLSRGAQLRTERGRVLDPDLGDSAPLGACAVELEELAQLSEGQLLGVQETAVDKPEGVHVRSGQRFVSGHHFGLGHLGQPLSFTVPVLYTR